MRITIESTDEVATLDGVVVRAWEGVTDDGIPCRVFVHRIAVADADGRDRDHDPFRGELIALRAPGRTVPCSPEEVAK